MVDRQLRIGFFATKPIAAGEEVVFDYQFERYGFVFAEWTPLV
jgi:SET domain-containing protein